MRGLHITRVKRHNEGLVFVWEADCVCGWWEPADVVKSEIEAAAELHKQETKTQGELF